MGIVVVNPNSDAFLMDADTAERIDADSRIVEAYWQQISRANEATMQLNDARRENRRLQAESAKMRELVADVHEALCSDKSGMFHKLILASMEDDMRELGIEVTE